MAVTREEERLGAYRIFGGLGRLMGYARGQWLLLILCILGSVLLAGIELSLPLLTRYGIDRYILPDYVRVQVRGSDEIEAWQLRREVVTTEEGIFIPLQSLKKQEIVDLEAQKRLSSERYYLLPSAQGPGEGRILASADFARLPSAERLTLRRDDLRGVRKLAILYALLLLLIFVVGYGVAVGLNRVGQNAVFRIRNQVFRHLHRLPIPYYDENPVGRLVTRVTNDTATISDLFTSVIATAVADVMLFVGILVVLLRLDAGLGWRILLLAPPLVVIAWWFKAVSQRVYRKIRVQLARINTNIQEAVSGVQVLKSFVSEERAAERFGEINEEYYRIQMRLIHLYAVFRPMIDLFGSAALALLIWIGGGAALRNEISIGTLVAFLLYLKMLFMPLQDLADKFNLVQSSVVSSERVLRILDTPPEPEGEGVSPESPLNGIVFDGVTFAYEPGRPVLEDVSFDVPAGKTVALVGPTGSGKTTITALLLGFYRLEPGNGRILVDGIPLERWNIRDLRRRFAFVQQDLFLFSGSLRENITLYGHPDEEVLRGALSVSRADTVLARVPGGLDHDLSERGATLSQGERQIVSFARALSHDPEVLILDEATASVDSRTEALIQEALGDLLRNRTAIVVAHRLSTIQDAHEILVLKKGKIVEKGDHADLMAEDGLYAHLYKTQFGAESA